MPTAVDTTTTITCRVTDPPLELYTTETAFRPNPVTVRFARALKIRPGDVVFDMGCGIGPLALKAALDGAGRVVGVDPVEAHCTLARRNAERHGVQDRVTFYQGRFFEPFRTEPALRDLKADVIVGDVSGIAHGVSKALGWYSDEVPTGGYDGADQICALLEQAGPVMKPDGKIYFAVAQDLSDAARIFRVANEHFELVENAFDKQYFEFPLSDAEVAAIHAAYPEGIPAFLTIQTGRRSYWRGQVYMASRPRR